MFKFLLFCKRTKVVLKYKCFKCKLHFFEFLSNFIQYFKPMTYTEDEALKKISECIKTWIESFEEKKVEFEFKNDIENTLNNLFQNSTITLKYYIKYPLPFLPHLEFLLCLEGDKYNIVSKHQILITTNTATRKSTDNFFEFIDLIDTSPILTILKNVEIRHGSIQINK